MIKISHLRTHTPITYMFEQDEGGANLDATPGDDDGSSPSVTNQSACGVKKKRHRVPKEKDRDAQVRGDSDFNNTL